MSKAVGPEAVKLKINLENPKAVVGASRLKLSNVPGSEHRI